MRQNHWKDSEMANNIEDRRKLTVDAVMFIFNSAAKDSEKNQVLQSLQKLSPGLAEDVDAAYKDYQKITAVLNDISSGIYDQELANIPAPKDERHRTVATSNERHQLIEMINKVAANRSTPMGHAWDGSPHDQLQQTSSFIYKSLTTAKNLDEEKSKLVHLVHLGYFDDAAVATNGLVSHSKTPMGERYAPNHANDPENTPADRFVNAGKISQWNQAQNQLKADQLEQQLQEMQANSLLKERDASSAGSKAAHDRMVEDQNTVILLRDRHQAWHDKNPGHSHSLKHGNIIVDIAPPKAHEHDLGR